MPKETLNYTNGEMTIVWKPRDCIHSTICWKGLIEVFNPRERPWIKMNNATTEKIIDQVKKCPSGALSYFLNTEPATKERQIPLQSDQGFTVEVTPNGPYVIKSDCRIIHPDGSQETSTGSVALCRCGSSTNKPYCDGSHAKVGFQG